MTAGYVARLEAVAEAAHDYLMDGGGSTEPLRRALAALAPAGDTQPSPNDTPFERPKQRGDKAGDTIVLTADEVEVIRRALDYDFETPCLESDERDAALSLLSRGQGK